MARAKRKSGSCGPRSPDSASASLICWSSSAVLPCCVSASSKRTSERSTPGAPPASALAGSQSPGRRHPRAGPGARRAAGAGVPLRIIGRQASAASSYSSAPAAAAPRPAACSAASSSSSATDASARRRRARGGGPAPRCPTLHPPALVHARRFQTGARSSPRIDASQMKRRDEYVELDDGLLRRRLQCLGTRCRSRVRRCQQLDSSRRGAGHEEQERRASPGRRAEAAAEQLMEAFRNPGAPAARSRPRVRLLRASTRPSSSAKKGFPGGPASCTRTRPGGSELEPEPAPRAAGGRLPRLSGPSVS